MMYGCVDAFQPKYYSGILATSTPPYSSRLEEFLLSGDYTVTGHNFNTIDIYDQKNKFSDCLKSEIIRFSDACTESVANSRAVRTSEKSIAWQFIELYYAGFFAAHGLLRLVGKSNSRLEQRAINLLNQQISRLGPVIWTANKGTYETEYFGASKMITLRKLPDAGGVHALLWQQFNQLINDILASPIAITLPVDDTACLIQIGTIIRNSDPTNPGHWLSNVRNKVNYRMEFDTWHPYGSPKQYYKSFRDYLNLTREPPNTGDIELYRAMWAAHAVCKILIENLTNIKLRSSKNNLLHKSLNKT